MDRFEAAARSEALIYTSGPLGVNQGARKDGRGNEPLPLRNVRCAETPEDS